MTTMSTKKRKTYENNQNMIDALEHKRRDPNISFERLAHMYDVGKSALHTRFIEQIPVNAKPGKSTILSSIAERELVDYLKTMGNWGFPLTGEEIRRIAGDYLRQQNPECAEPGSHWLTNFLTRHKLSLSWRKGRTIDVMRAAVSREVLDDFYQLLEDIFSRDDVDHDRLPNLLWNCDELGMRPDKTDKRVIAQRGSRQVHITTGKTPKRYTTTLACVSAAGVYMKPLVLYRGDREPKQNSAKVSWNGAVYTVSHSGWMTSVNFVTFLTKVFIPESEPYTEPNEYRYLIVDGHTSHCSLEAIKICVDHKIRLIRLPSHSTHLLQPLDVAVFKPFRDISERAIKEISLNVPKSLTDTQIPKLLEIVWPQLQSSYAINGFRASGIFPLNRLAITDSQIATSLQFDNQLLSTVDSSMLSLNNTETEVSFFVNKLKTHINTTCNTLIQTRQRNRFGVDLTNLPSNRPNPDKCTNCNLQYSPFNFMKEDEDMIFCEEDGCNSWYHIVCVFALRYLHKDEIAAISPWICHKHN